MTFDQSLKLELIKWGLTLVSLTITWCLGQLIINYWDKKKKARELELSDIWDEKKKTREFNMAAINQFQQLYGEFKTVWRLARSYHNSLSTSSEYKLPQPKDDDYCWELMDRASKAEGGVEALLVKVATEYDLSPDNKTDLGLYRQAFQQLREAIRTGKSEGFQRKSPEYYLFDELSCVFLKILSFDKLLKKDNEYSKKAIEQYRKIKDVSEGDWKREVETRGQNLKVALEAAGNELESDKTTAVKELKGREVT